MKSMLAVINILDGRNLLTTTSHAVSCLSLTKFKKGVMWSKRRPVRRYIFVRRLCTW